MNDKKALRPWVKAVVDAEPKFQKINATIGAVNWDVEANFARQVLQNNKFLSECPPSSIMDAMINVAAVGLSLNPAEKLAYLVPRDGRCVLDISYQGLLKIATDTGSIMWGRAELVYDGDTFTYNGPAALPCHVADAFDHRRGTPEGFRGVYCIAKTKEGDYLIDTMPAEEVFRVRDCSAAYAKYGRSDTPNKAGPWVTFFGEMAKKTMIKRAQKTWPRTDKSNRLDQAIHILNQHEGLAYTEEQRRFYEQQLTRGDDPLEFLAFTKSLDARTNAALFNHWEYGDKTKMKQAARDLEKQGWDIINETVANIRQAVQEDDDSAVHEMMGDLSPNAQELILNNLEPAEIDYCQHIGYEVAA